MAETKTASDTPIEEDEKKLSPYVTVPESVSFSNAYPTGLDTSSVDVFEVDDSPVPPTFNPDKLREKMRGDLAYGLFWLVCTAIVIPLIALMNHWITIQEYKDIQASTLTPALSIFAAVTGFYYGGGKSY